MARSRESPRERARGRAVLCAGWRRLRCAGLALAVIPARGRVLLLHIAGGSVFSFNGLEGRRGRRAAGQGAPNPSCRLGRGGRGRRARGRRARLRLEPGMHAQVARAQVVVLCAGETCWLLVKRLFCAAGRLGPRRKGRRRPRPRLARQRAGCRIAMARTGDPRCGGEARGSSEKGRGLRAKGKGLQGMCLESEGPRDRGTRETAGALRAGLGGRRALRGKERGRGRVPARCRGGAAILAAGLKARAGRLE